MTCANVTRVRNLYAVYLVHTEGPFESDGVISTDPANHPDWSRYSYSLCNTEDPATGFDTLTPALFNNEHAAQQMADDYRNRFGAVYVVIPVTILAQYAEQASQTFSAVERTRQSVPQPWFETSSEAGHWIGDYNDEEDGEI